MSDDRAYVLDILLAARTIREFVTGVPQQVFLKNLEKQSAVLTSSRFSARRPGACR